MGGTAVREDQGVECREQHLRIGPTLKQILKSSSELGLGGGGEGEPAIIGQAGGVGHQVPHRS